MAWRQLQWLNAGKAHHTARAAERSMPYTADSSASVMQRSTATGRIAAVPGSAATVAAPAGDKAVCHVPSETARNALFGVAKDQVCEVPGAVRGELPAWLCGSLLVNGGGDYSHMNHMFDGYALVTKVRLSGGKAWGSQRYLDTKVYRAYKKEGRVVLREFATRAEVSGPLGELKGLLAQLWGLMTKNPQFTDNASVSLQAVGSPGTRGSRLLAMSETPAASYIINPDDLTTQQQVKYADGVPGDLTTAHPSILTDGTFVNFSRTLPLGGFHVYKQDPVTLARTQVGYVADRRPLSPSWLHDFAATDNYAVLLEQPLYMSLASLLLGTPATHLFMNWLPQDEVKVHLVPLDGSGAVRSFTCPTFFYFHVGNAFETADGSSLCVDLAAYDDPQVLNDLLIQPLVNPVVDAEGQLKQQISQSWYKRLTIPLHEAAASRLQAPQLLAPPQPSPAGQQHDPLGGFCEFPAINPARRGAAYRYAYCLSAARPTNMGNALSKMDLQQGTAQTWHEPGGALGEPVFVARPDGSAEDDGVVLAPGVDAAGCTFLLVMDATNWTELARVQFPFGTPYRFHGIWLQG